MSNAPGQLLGYLLQLQRALLHLMEGGPGSSVCVEVIGDVGSHSSSGSIAEEDKSSISRNPITDKSIDLWKTFHNWAQMVSAGTVDPRHTRFILYTNHAGRSGIVDILDAADTPEKIAEARDKAKEILDDLDPSSPVARYLSSIISDENLFSQIIANFEFVVGSKTGGDEVKELLKNKLLISEVQADFMHQELLGWLSETVMQEVANRSDAVVRWEQYKARFSVIFLRARGRELIDFTKDLAADSDDVTSELRAYPNYLRQLEIVGLSESVQIQAVSDFLRSKVNIERWIEDELIGEIEAKDLEDRLKRIWDSAHNRVAITSKSNTVEERGALVYYDCIARQEMIANQNPPASTIPGVFHNLANDHHIGWHADWKNILKK